MKLLHHGYPVNTTIWSSPARRIIQDTETCCKETNMEGSEKGTVCVTGGTGFLASWLIMKLLHHGYSINTTIRSSSERKRHISYLKDLPGASERLCIFNANFDKPDSFGPAIEGCIGVFHVSHPMDFEGKETEEEITRKAINGTLGILQACLKAKTVKRVVYTSSITSVLYCKGLDIVDESTWCDIDYIRSLNSFGSVYSISKTLTEKACLEFAEKHGLDLISILPSVIHGPFLTPNMPGSVGGAMTMISDGHETLPTMNILFVHTDDVARAHIFLFEYPNAKGRYICSALEITVHELAKFLSARYLEYQIQSPDSLNKMALPKMPGVSSKKLLDTGFKFSYGLEEMYDDAIRCCKEKALL